MLKVIITDAVVSKGFEGAPALRYSENNGNTTAAWFKIGHRVYDSRVEGNHRFFNLAVKAFGSVCERIQKMKPGEGSYIHLIGRLDEEKWEENGQPHSRMVVIADEVEYAGGSVKSGSSGANNAGSTIPPTKVGQPAGNGYPAQSGQSVAQTPYNGQMNAGVQRPQSAQGEQMGMPSGFTGYDTPDGGGNVFFP